MTDTSLEQLAQNPGQTSQSIDLTLGFDAKPLDYLFVLLKTTFFTIISLGLYYPWARAERLRFLMNHTRLGTSAFSFTGHGKEIAVGYLKGLLVYGSIYGVFLYSSHLAAESPLLGGLLSAVSLMLFYGLLPLAIWGGKAYRLSRTRYRSIYFSIDREQRRAFFKRYFLDLLLVPLTLGFYAPVLMFNLQKNLTNATRWGNVRFSFTGRLADSYALAVKNAILTAISFGLYTPFAIASRLNFHANNTRIDEKVYVRSQISGTDVFVLIFVPLIVTTLTLGLAYPWITVRTRQRFLKRFSVIGPFDFSTVRQSKDLASASGETLGDLWNVDMSLGV